MRYEVRKYCGEKEPVLLTLLSLARKALSSPDNVSFSNIGQSGSQAVVGGRHHCCSSSVQPFKSASFQVDGHGDTDAQARVFFN
jgi:hypothetical protein